MACFFDRKDGHTVVVFDGDLDSAEVQEVRNEVNVILTNGLPIIFDLSRVEFIDSSGIGLIVHVYRSLTARRLKVAVSGAREQPLELLKATQLDRFLPFAASVDEARAAVGAG